MAVLALAKTVEGGHTQQTKRDHLRRVWAATGIKPEELDIPEPPQDVLYLWMIARNFPHPLSFAEVVAWSQLHGRKLARWEVEALVTLDGVRSNG